MSDHPAENTAYRVPDGIADAATEAAYREFCRVLGHWDPQFPGQKDAVRAALYHAWEISTNLIEAAVLRRLADEMHIRAQCALARVVEHPSGSVERAGSAGRMVAFTEARLLADSWARDRDAFDLTDPS